MSPSDLRKEDLEALYELAAELPERHLHVAGGNRSAAARNLGISREGLRLKMRRLGI